MTMFLATSRDSSIKVESASHRDAYVTNRPQ